MLHLLWPGERRWVRAPDNWGSQSGISWWMEEQGSGGLYHLEPAWQGQAVARFYNTRYFINDCLARKSDPQCNITFSVPGDTFFRVSTRSDGSSVGTMADVLLQVYLLSYWCPMSNDVTHHRCGTCHHTTHQLTSSSRLLILGNTSWS